MRWLCCGKQFLSFSSDVDRRINKETSKKRSNRIVSFCPLESCENAIKIKYFVHVNIKSNRVDYAWLTECLINNMIFRLAFIIASVRNYFILFQFFQRIVIISGYGEMDQWIANWKLICSYTECTNVKNDWNFSTFFGTVFNNEKICVFHTFWI